MSLMQDTIQSRIISNSLPLGFLIFLSFLLLTQKQGSTVHCGGDDEEEEDDDDDDDGVNNGAELNSRDSVRNR